MKRRIRLFLQSMMMLLISVSLMLTNASYSGAEAAAAAGPGHPDPGAKNGLDPQGRMVAKFGSPVIDGLILVQFKGHLSLK